MAIYHRIAGTSLDRLSALSDGVFAIAMTLLVLEVHVPAKEAVHSEGAVLDLLADTAPRLLVCLLGFVTLGMFWLGQQAQLDQMERTDRSLTWIHLVFLFGISLVPFTTGLLSEYTPYRIALLVYWADLLFLGLAQLAGLRYARRAGLLKAGAPKGALGAIRRRIVVVQGLYAVAVALCFVSPYLSIALIVLLQLASAVQPRIRPFNRV